MTAEGRVQRTNESIHKKSALTSQISGAAKLEQYDGIYPGELATAPRAPRIPVLQPRISLRERPGGGAEGQVGKETGDRLPLPHGGLPPSGVVRLEPKERCSEEGYDMNYYMTCTFKLLNRFYAFAPKVL